MVIIFNEAGLVDVQPPCVAQSFVNHNARLFKVFIIGHHRYVVRRPSIKNLYAGSKSFDVVEYLSFVPDTVYFL